MLQIDLIEYSFLRIMNRKYKIFAVPLWNISESKFDVYFFQRILTEGGIAEVVLNQSRSYFITEPVHFHHHKET